MSQNLFAELKDVEFQQWRHHPISRAFLAFMADAAANYREGAMDLWEAGRLNHPTHAENGDVLRGRCLALRETAEVDLATIKQFYSIEDQAEDERK